MKIAFNESTRSYRGHGYRFTEPGEYEVEDAIAKRLLKDFPMWFETVEGSSSAREESTKDEGQSKPVSKMNKEELLARAEELGLEVNKDVSNKQLQQAIHDHQEGANQ